jgi:hypothetical protein
MVLVQPSHSRSGCGLGLALAVGSSVVRSMRVGLVLPNVSSLPVSALVALAKRLVLMTPLMPSVRMVDSRFMRSVMPAAKAAGMFR